MKKVFGIMGLSLLSPFVLAKNDFDIKQIQQVPIYDQHIQNSSDTAGVMQFHFSKRSKDKLKNRLNNLKSRNVSHDHTDLPVAINLGMNNAPVLNQGRHGSCVTFSNTGALNAALGKGDEVSQLCNLALGKTMEADGYNMSGWNGSFGPMVLGQLFSFGYVSKDAQRQYGCGGLTEYPLEENGEDNVTPMSLKDFHAHSEALRGKLAWSQLLSAYDWLEDEYCPCKFLKQVKKSLANHHRVTFGMLLDVKVGHGGAAGKYKSADNYDTWMLTPEIEQHIKDGTVDAGHELVIYGYDDDAVIGNQKGILYIRNSWSERAGYHGDYFMTYDYFKALAYEGQKIMVSNGKMPPPGK